MSSADQTCAAPSAAAEEAPASSVSAASAQGVEYPCAAAADEPRSSSPALPAGAEAAAGRGLTDDRAPATGDAGGRHGRGPAGTQFRQLVGHHLGDALDLTGWGSRLRGSYFRGCARLASSGWRAAVAREAGRADDPAVLRAAFARMMGVDQDDVPHVNVLVGDFADWMGRMFTLLEVSRARSHRLRDATVDALGDRHTTRPALDFLPQFDVVLQLLSTAFAGDTHGTRDRTRSPTRVAAGSPAAGPGGQ